MHHSHRIWERSWQSCGLSTTLWLRKTWRTWRSSGGSRWGTLKKTKSQPKISPEMVLGELWMQDNALVLKSLEDLEKQRGWELGTPNPQQSTPKGPQ